MHCQRTHCPSLPFLPYHEVAFVLLNQAGPANLGWGMVVKPAPHTLCPVVTLSTLLFFVPERVCLSSSSLNNQIQVQGRDGCQTSLFEVTKSQRRTVQHQCQGHQHCNNVIQGKNTMVRYKKHSTMHNNHTAKSVSLSLCPCPPGGFPSSRSSPFPLKEPEATAQLGWRWHCCLAGDITAVANQCITATLIR